MTKGDIKVKSSFPERHWEVSIMGIKEMIIELEANAQNRVCKLIIPLSNVEESLTEIPAKIQRWTYVEIMMIIAVVVKILAQLPTAFPCLLVGVASSGIAEDALPVNRA
jgi:hypothetical protein